MIRIIFTYRQLKAAKDLLSHRSPVDWVAYEEFKHLIQTAPLDLPEEVAHSEDGCYHQFGICQGRHYVETWDSSECRPVEEKAG